MPRMAPTVSALAREAMRVAFEDFEKTVTPADSKQMRSASAIGQVRDAALDIERQLAARGSLRNMRRLAPLLNGLEHYGRVIEVLCNGTPFLNWIWAPISLILRLASEYLEAFEHIMKGYTQIAKALGRFEMLSNAFPKDADFQHTLAIFYADILEFHKHAYKFVTRRGWHLLFNTSWGRFQRRFTHLLHDLEKHGELIDMEANARNITEARVHREEFRQWREQNIEKIEQEERHQATKQYQSVLSWLKIDETEQIAIFESICEEGSKYPGTCSWMSNNSRISSWLSRKPDDRQLWVQGNPGTGKSVMSTQLVNFLQSSKSHVLYHFCSYTYASSTRYDAILRSLVHQLLRSSGELTAYAYQEYVVGKKTPTTPSLEQLLGTLLDSLSEAHRSDYVWIIVDGLEECETAKQTRLVNLLLNLASSKDSSHCSTVCKVLLCSRSLPTRTRRLSKKQILSLSRETEHISKAIKLYASQRLRSLHERLRQLEMSAEEIDNVEQLIAEKAGGMFLYARLVLDYLSTNLFFNGEELIQSIERLPATVTEFYQNILSRILVHLDARSTGRIKSVLGWVAFAKRPLRRLELLSALAFSSGSSDVTSPAPRYILDICSPLVEENHDSTLAFIHVSVKEFLQSCQNGVGIDERVAIQEHALASMACLLSAVKIFCKDYCENARLLRLVKGVHGLHIYATEYWTEYLLANAASTGGIDASSSLVDLSYRLTDALAKSSGSVAIPATSLDDRLKLLQEHPRLQLQITRSLWARSQKRLESEVLCQINETPNTNHVKAIFDDGVSKMLGSYQQAVETLLDQDSCPGASIEELRFFKSQFLTSAYTCRLRSCPRATIGFGSAQLRHEHEIGHAGGFRCSIVGCQYPPFRTSQALKSHVDLYHTTTPTRRSIRKVGRLSLQVTSTTPTVRNSILDMQRTSKKRTLSPPTQSSGPSSTGAFVKSTQSASQKGKACSNCRRNRDRCDQEKPKCTRCRIGNAICRYDEHQRERSQVSHPDALVKVHGFVDHPDQLRPTRPQAGKNRSESSGSMSSQLTHQMKCKCNDLLSRYDDISCLDCNTWQHAECYYDYSKCFQYPAIHICENCLTPEFNDLLLEKLGPKDRARFRQILQSCRNNTLHPYAIEDEAIQLFHSHLPDVATFYITLANVNGRIKKKRDLGVSCVYCDKPNQDEMAPCHCSDWFHVACVAGNQSGSAQLCTECELRSIAARYTSTEESTLPRNDVESATDNDMEEERIDTANHSMTSPNSVPVDAAIRAYLQPRVGTPHYEVIEQIIHSCKRSAVNVHAIDKEVAHLFNQDMSQVIGFIRTLVRVNHLATIDYGKNLGASCVYCNVVDSSTTDKCTSGECANWFHDTCGVLEPSRPLHMRCVVCKLKDMVSKYEQQEAKARKATMWSPNLASPPSLTNDDLSASQDAKVDSSRPNPVTENELGFLKHTDLCREPNPRPMDGSDAMEFGTPLFYMNPALYDAGYSEPDPRLMNENHAIASNPGFGNPPGIYANTIPAEARSTPDSSSTSDQFPTPGEIYDWLPTGGIRSRRLAHKFIRRGLNKKHMPKFLDILWWVSILDHRHETIYPRSFSSNSEGFNFGYDQDPMAYTIPNTFQQVFQEAFEDDIMLEELYLKNHSLSQRFHLLTTPPRMDKTS